MNELIASLAPFLVITGGALYLAKTWYARIEQDAQLRADNEKREQNLKVLNNQAAKAQQQAKDLTNEINKFFSDRDASKPKPDGSDTK